MDVDFTAFNLAHIKWKPAHLKAGTISCREKALLLQVLSVSEYCGGKRRKHLNSKSLETNPLSGIISGKPFTSIDSPSDTEMCNMNTDLLLRFLRFHPALQNFEAGVK